MKVGHERKDGIVRACYYILHLKRGLRHGGKYEKKQRRFSINIYYYTGFCSSPSFRAKGNERHALLAWLARCCINRKKEGEKETSRNSRLTGLLT